jgi:hypothetical protein
VKNLGSIINCTSCRSSKRWALAMATKNYISLTQTESDIKSRHKINHNQRPLHILTAGRALFCPDGFRERAAALTLPYTTHLAAFLSSDAPQRNIRRVAADQHKVITFFNFNFPAKVIHLLPR